MANQNFNTFTRTGTAADQAAFDVGLRAPAADGPGIYFCPMHAEVVQKTPGKCEPCGGMVLFHQDELFGAADLAEVVAAFTAAGLLAVRFSWQPTQPWASPGWMMVPLHMDCTIRPFS